MDKEGLVRAPLLYYPYVMQPLSDRVLIVADEAEDQTGSGIKIFREWKKLPHTGVVQEVGPEVNQIKKGDRVHFNRYAFIPLGDNNFLGTVKNVNAVIE